MDTESLEYRAFEYFYSKNFTYAEYCFKQLCKEAPRDYYWYFRGLCYKFQEMWDSALFCFEKAMKYRYNKNQLYYHIGSTLSELENSSLARFYIKKAKSLMKGDERPELKLNYLKYRYGDKDDNFTIPGHQWLNSPTLEHIEI